MPKAKVTMTIVTEYPVDLSKYSGAKTPAECLLIDVRSLRHDPSSIFDVGKAEVSIAGVLVEDDGEDPGQLILAIEDGSFVAPQVAE